jgi:hypothetical protein
MSEKTSVREITEIITRCLDAIANRRVRIAESEEPITLARARALKLSADAVLGSASEREAINARAALDKLEAECRTWQLELDGLEQRHSELMAELAVAERQRQLELTAERAIEAISAALALDQHFAGESTAAQSRTIVGLGQALHDLIVANNAAAAAWPDPTAQYKPNAFSPGGMAEKVRLEQLGSLVWAHICRASGDTLAYSVPPAISPLAGSAREHFNGMARAGISPLFSQTFAGSWVGIFEHAGRTDLAEKMQEALEGGAAGKKGARKAAAS